MLVSEVKRNDWEMENNFYLSDNLINLLCYAGWL